MFHGTLDLEGAVPVTETAIQDALFERDVIVTESHSSASILMGYGRNRSQMVSHTTH